MFVCLRRYCDNAALRLRQALGSPVTVLETVETGDSENPVWVKIRIRYHDREFIGDSSKTYIRMQNEE